MKHIEKSVPLKEEFGVSPNSFLYPVQYNIEFSHSSVSAKENLAPEEGGDPPSGGEAFPSGYR